MSGTEITRRFFLIGGAAFAFGCSRDREAAVDASPDTHTPTPDAPTCPAQVFYPWFNAGPPSAFATGVPVYFPSMENIGGDVYVVRDAGGLFAMIATCSYDPTRTCIANGTACSSGGDQFLCPSCGSRYALDGSVIAGPATMPLQYRAMCFFSSVLVNLAEPAEPTARLVA